MQLLKQQASLPSFGKCEEQSSISLSEGASFAHTSVRADIQTIQACLLVSLYGRMMSTHEDHEMVGCV